MLNHNCSNQAIDRIPYRRSLFSEISINRRRKLKRGDIIFKINQIGELLLD